MIRFLELAWLAIACVSALMGIYQTVTAGFQQGLWFFIFTFVASIMYSIRRNQRIKIDNNKNDNRDDSGQS
jgi:hypothetical membrane protein